MDGRPRPREVARLGFEVPRGASFVVHGTVPLPPGTYLPGGTRTLALEGPDGRPIEDTQIEVVSLYPADERDGADVVELLARVSRSPDWITGRQASLSVVSWAGDPAPPPGPPGVELLIDGPRRVPATVQALLADPLSLVLVLTDPLGRTYTALPLRGAEGEKVVRHGRYATTLRTFEVLAPTAGTPGLLYPHHLAVHAYLTTWDDEELLSVDLRFSNGADGFDPTSPLDDPLGKVYFASIDLFVAERELPRAYQLPSDRGHIDPRPRKATWLLQQEFQDPSAFRPGDRIERFPVSPEVTYLRFPLVRALPGGAMHVVPCHAQFHRRLVLSPPELEDHARDLLEGAGQAFCRPGEDDRGRRLWSWWNPETARYFPQRQVLPTLDFRSNDGVNPYGGLGDLRRVLASWLAAIEGPLEAGTAFPVGGVPEVGSPRQLGWARPLGEPGGGTTGGSGIQFLEGERTAAAASLAGYRFLKLRHRLQTERQPNVLYRLDGEPTSHDQWLAPGGAYSTLQKGFSMDFGPNDPTFCAGAPLWAQNAYVAAKGLEPPYESDAQKEANLLSYSPHDAQHLVRYVRFPMALAWLGNDPLARDDLHVQGELYRMTYSEVPNVAGNSQPWTLHKDARDVKAAPHWGFDVGRAEGWGLGVVSAAYSMADAEWRARNRAWFDEIVDTYALGMARARTSSYLDGVGAPYDWGLLVAKHNNKLYGLCPTCPRARQVWEEMILEIGLRGVARSVYGAGNLRRAELSRLSRLSAYGLLSPVSWNEAGHTIWFACPVSDTTYAPDAIFDCDPSSSPGCAGNPLPPGFPPRGSSDFYAWTALASAWEQTGDPLFLERAHDTLTFGAPCAGDCADEIIAILEGMSPVAPQHYSEWSMLASLLGTLEATR